MLRVMDVATGEVIDGPIDRVRYSPMAWLPGGRGAVLRPPPPAGRGAGRRGAVPPAGLPAPGRHRPGRGRAGVRRGRRQDGLLRARHLARRALAGGDGQPRHRPPQRLLPGRPDRPRRPGAPAWRTVIEGADAQAWPSLGRDGRLYLLTDLDAPRRRLVVADPARAGAGRLDRPAGRGSRTAPCSKGWRWPATPWSRSGAGTRSARSPSTTATRVPGGRTWPLPGLGHRRRHRPARRGSRGLDRLHRPRHAVPDRCTSTCRPASWPRAPTRRAGRRRPAAMSGPAR